jgi:hypothetical protein
MATEALTRGAWPRVQWGPVIAGVLCAIACHIVLGLFGAAFGFAASPTDSKAIGIGAGIWGLVTPFAASLIGAWVAVRLAAEREEAGAMLHGALVWSIGLIAGAVFLAGVLSWGATALGTAASGNVGARAVERLTPANRVRAQTTAEEAAKSAAAGSGLAGVAALLGLGGAALGATLGMRTVRGEGLRPRRGALAHEPMERAPETGVAYSDQAGYVTTRAPGAVEREGPLQHH